MIATSRSRHAGRLRRRIKPGLALILVPLALSGCAKLIGGYANIQGRITPSADDAAQPATVPMIIDGDQIVIELGVVAPDGRARTVLALVNMGQSRPWLKRHLYDELQIDKGQKLILHLAGRTIAVDASAVQVEPDREDLDRQFGPFFPAHKVEMVLQAGVFSGYALVLDYAGKKLTLARSDQLRPQGIAVPIKLNPETGLVTVAATIDGRSYNFVIDGGAPYSWVRGSAASDWLQDHPDWRRAAGAVGASNYNMLDYAFERDGFVLRVPTVDLGAIVLRDVGLLGTGALLQNLGDQLFGEVFWNAWQENAPEPVVGWLGNNALKHYQLTVDYPNLVSYWLKRGDPDPHELDQVGVTLAYDSGDYTIAGIVQNNGHPTVQNLIPGDKLRQIDGQPVHGWPREKILSALHGHPGEIRSLVIERNGSIIEQTAVVSAF